jgi:hypothetical protein
MTNSRHAGIQRSQIAIIMPHFKDDNITNEDHVTNEDIIRNEDDIDNDEAVMRKGSNRYHENDVRVVDGEKIALDAAFAELKAVLPDCTSVEGTTQDLADNKEANSIDFQDTTLADLYRQSSILSRAINHLRYLERGREQLLQENKAFAATVNGLREDIRNLVTIEGAKVN